MFRKTVKKKCIIITIDAVNVYITKSCLLEKERNKII